MSNSNFTLVPVDHLATDDADVAVDADSCFFYLATFVSPQIIIVLLQEYIGRCFIDIC